MAPVLYPDADDMALPARKPQLDFIRAFIDSFGQAATAPDFKHPATGQHYSEFIDVDAWIDHHILNTLAKNVDGMRFSHVLPQGSGRPSRGRASVGLRPQLRHAVRRAGHRARGMDVGVVKWRVRQRRVVAIPL